MNMIAQNLLFAADIGAIVSFVIVVFGIISWIANAIREKQQAQVRQVPRRPAKPNAPLQNEIDIFLQEVTQKRGEKAPRQRTASRPAARPRRLVKDARSPETAAAPKRKKRDRLPGEEIATRKSPGSENLGKGVRQHVKEHILSHSVSDEAEQRLGHDVFDSVSQHLGDTRTLQPETAEGSSMIDEVRKLLANPATAGQAILLHEILTSPRLRRR